MDEAISKATKELTSGGSAGGSAAGSGSPVVIKRGGYDAAAAAVVRKTLVFGIRTNCNRIECVVFISLSLYFFYL